MLYVTYEDFQLAFLCYILMRTRWAEKTEQILNLSYKPCIS